MCKQLNFEYNKSFPDPKREGKILPQDFIYLWFENEKDALVLAEDLIRRVRTKDDRDIGVLLSGHLDGQDEPVENDKYKKAMRKLLNAVNKVSSNHRHGTEQRVSSMDNLCNVQLEVEELINEM